MAVLGQFLRAGRRFSPTTATFLTPSSLTPLTNHRAFRFRSSSAPISTRAKTTWLKLQFHHNNLLLWNHGLELTCQLRCELLAVLTGVSSVTTTCTPSTVVPRASLVQTSSISIFYSSPLCLSMSPAFQSWLKSCLQKAFPVFIPSSLYAGPGRREEEAGRSAYCRAFWRDRWMRNGPWGLLPGSTFQSQ